MSLEQFKNIPTSNQILDVVNKEAGIVANLHESECGPVFVINRIERPRTQVVMHIKQDGQTVGIIRGVSANNPTVFVLTTFHNVLSSQSLAARLLFPKFTEGNKAFHLKDGFQDLEESSFKAFCNILSNTTSYRAYEKFSVIKYEGETQGIDLKQYR